MTTPTDDTPDTPDADAPGVVVPSGDHTEPRTEVPPRPPRVHAPSLVLVNTGHGKGKSTAAFGTAIRALARGWTVGVVQFIKSGDWRTGEAKVLRELGADWWSMGDGFSWESGDLDASEQRARAAWQHTRELLTSGSHDVVVLDEITYPLIWGWIDLQEAVAAVHDRETTTNVICTGRDAPQALIDVADTVSEVRAVKHAFQRGIRARRGIDF